MTDMTANQATDGVPTYLGRGDPARRFADYYPAWVDKLAGDVTLEGSILDGALQGADAIRAVIAGVRELYDRQDFTAIAFLEVLVLGAVDLLGFSIGSFVAQEIALIRPVGVRRLVLPSSSPARRRRDARLGTRGDRSRGRARAQSRRVSRRFFARSAASREAGVVTLTSRSANEHHPT